jgi:hypothetical protein
VIKVGSVDLEILLISKFPEMLCISKDAHKPPSWNFERQKPLSCRLNLNNDDYSVVSDLLLLFKYNLFIKLRLNSDIINKVFIKS